MEIELVEYSERIVYNYNSSSPTHKYLQRDEENIDLITVYTRHDSLRS